jgi:hypothetical protein
MWEYKNGLVLIGFTGRDGISANRLYGFEQFKALGHIW